MKVLINIKEKTYDFDTVFSSCSFEFNGNLIKIEGKNGSGKSTLFKMLSNHTNFNGDVYVNNELVSKNYLSKLFVLVDQDIALIENKTVLYNIRTVSNKFDKNLIEKFKFDDKLNILVSTLSGGWKKKLMILLAFVSNPKILLLDEYTNYLDKEFIDIVNDYILTFSKNHMVLYIDHNNSIGGKVIDISKPEQYKDITNSKKLKEKDMSFNFQYLKSQFSIKKILALIILIMISVFQITAISFTKANKQDLYINYLIQNSLYYVRLSTQLDVETENSVFYLDSNSSLANSAGVDSVAYTESLDEEIKESLDVPTDTGKDYVECYVSEYNSKMLGTSFACDNLNYFVSGVLDMGITNYPEDYVDYINCIYIVSDVPESYNDEFLYTSKNEIKKIEDYIGYVGETGSNISNTIYQYSNIFKYIFIISSVIFAIFIIFSKSNTSKDEKKLAYLLTHYKHSKKELFILRLTSFLIIALIQFIFCFIFSLISLKIFFYNTVDIYYGNYVSFLDLLIVSLFYLLLMIISDLFFVRKTNKVKLEE